MRPLTMADSATGDPASGDLLEDAPSDVITALRSCMHDLPAELDELASVALKSIGGHGRVQALRVACQRLVPGLPDDLFDSCTTMGDLIAWLEHARAAGRMQERPAALGAPGVSRIHLRPLVAQDIDVLYRTSLDPAVNHRWRFRGTTPSPDAFARHLFEGVLCQFMVSPQNGDAPLGLLAAYAADLSSGHCQVAIQRVSRPIAAQMPLPRVPGAMIEGAMLFLDYLFEHFTLRKLYFEVPEFNESLLAHRDSDVVKEEGRLRQHSYHAGRYWDSVVYAIYRNDWLSFAGRFG